MYSPGTPMMPHMSSGNMMSDIKSMIMPMIMMKEFSGNSTKTENNNNLYSIVMIFIVTQLIDFFSKMAMDVYAIGRESIARKVKNMLSSVEKETMTSLNKITNTIVVKKSKIRMIINTADKNNHAGCSIIDYLTKLNVTEYVSIISGNVILSQKDPICMSDEFKVYAQLIDTQTNLPTSLTQNNGGDKQGNQGNSNQVTQEIEVYSFTLNMADLRAYLFDIEKKWITSMKNKLGTDKYYFDIVPQIAPEMMPGAGKDLSRLAPHVTFTKKLFKTNRKFSTVFGEEMKVIRKRVEFFLNNRKWYEQKGLPYTLGLLLTGPPGTGKTSTIKTIAGESNRHIININLNNDLTKTQLENLFYNEELMVVDSITNKTELVCIPIDERMYIFEDIDCQSDVIYDRSHKIQSNVNEPMPQQPVMSRSISPSEQKRIMDEYKQKLNAWQIKEMTLKRNNKHTIDLSFLLNLLDGVLEQPGRIVIMTSNYPELLDSALIRPGRIDCISHFGYCSNQTIKELFSFIYDHVLTPDENLIIDELTNCVITPAKLAQIIFEHVHERDRCLEKLKEINESHKLSNSQTNSQNESPITIEQTELPIATEKNTVSTNTVIETEVIKEESLSEASFEKFEEFLHPNMMTLTSEPESHSQRSFGSAFNLF